MLIYFQGTGIIIAVLVGINNTVNLGFFVLVLGQVSLPFVCTLRLEINI
jgi:hypothetical protein